MPERRRRYPDGCEPGSVALGASLPDDEGWAELTSMGRLSLVEIVTAASCLEADEIPYGKLTQLVSVSSLTRLPELQKAGFIHTGEEGVLVTTGDLFLWGDRLIQAVESGDIEICGIVGISTDLEDVE